MSDALGQIVAYAAPDAAVFPCGTCGEVASTITLLPPGSIDPQAPKAEDPGHRGTATIFPHVYSLSLDGPLHTTHTLVSPVGS